MPASFAHYRFAAGVLPLLPAHVQAAVRKNREIYDIGAHGPDIFFFHNPFVRTSTVELGYRFHNTSGKDFFTRAARKVRLDPSEKGMAYLFGVLSHYVLDACCHPFVEDWHRDQIISHVAMESEFDRYLLFLDGKNPPHRQDLSRHIRPTPKDITVIAKFYGVSRIRVGQSCENFLRFTRLLCPTGKASRTIVENGIRIFPGLADYLIPSKANPRYLPLDQTLMEQYHKAESLFPLLVRQLSAFLENGTPLGELFLPTFN